jgi:glyoxylase-like metal-dependent hydrolase (beta-lactamase superfamily II)
VSPFDELGDGVFRRRYESLDLNVGIVIGATAVLVIDTRASHQQADELRDELGRLTPLPVGWVVNTHFHWDHTWGNARFLPAPVWGHDRCRSEMVAKGEEVRARVLASLPPQHHDAVREVEIVPPDHTFAEAATLDLGNRRVRLAYRGRAHTNSDITVAVPDADVLFLGDMIEEGAPPAFGDSFPLDWAPTLRATPGAGTMVPGHGNVVDRDYVATQTAEIAHIADAIRETHAAGLPPEILHDRGPYPAATMREAVDRGYAQLGTL